MPEPLDVQAALGAVEEPELRRSIVELGLLQGVAVDGRTAVVALAVPLPGDESRAELTRRVVEAVGRVPGIDRVDVDIRELNRRMMAEIIEEYSAPGEELPPEMSKDWEPDVEDVGRAADERRRWKAVA